MFRKVKKLHFVGIGGSGMSGIAEILLNMGYEVSGSDLRLYSVTQHLERLGATIYQGHRADNVGDVDVVVISSAVRGDNVEILTAAEKNIPIIRRAEMLAELMRMKFGIAVAGTHGKSTTSSLIGEILEKGHLDPTIIVGGKVVNLKSSARLGTSEYLVVEADEFDRSFLKLAPTIAVTTNLEPEHMECYSDLDDLKKAFVEFMNKVPFFGAVIICLDEANLQEIIPEIDRRIITYGLSTQADLRATRISFEGNSSTFEVEARGKNLGPVFIRLLGLHNVKNSLAAIATGLELGIPFELIKQALAEFSGVYRRFQIKGEAAGIMVVDDFAHHPTEVKATLQATKLGYNRRVVVIFQPHLYSRTQAFHQEFGKALLYADIAVVTDVYPSREDPIEGVNGSLIVGAAKNFGHRNALYVENKDNVLDKIIPILKEGDMVVTMGAGNIYKIGEQLLEVLAKSKEDQENHNLTFEL
ncbi:UDP-N-acetylmuramate--L-alanine ligase [bacterium]|nr:UDP-N-acetylmuramate--L-alanine ligase [bacterium]